MKKICVVCGKEFEAKNRVICCSPECTEINRKRKEKAYKQSLPKKPPIYKKCVVCGKEFQAHGTSKCCSPECSMKRSKQNQSEYRRSKLQPRVCQYCGKEFIPRKQGNTHYCSAECYAAAVAARKEKVRKQSADYRFKQKQEKIERRSRHFDPDEGKRTCPICGKKFGSEWGFESWIYKKGNQIYCSYTCYRKATAKPVRKSGRPAKGQRHESVQ